MAVGLPLRYPHIWIPYARHNTNETVWGIAGCLPVSEMAKSHHSEVLQTADSNGPRGSEWVSSVLPPRQHSIGYMGDGFYRSKDPKNSRKNISVFMVGAALRPPADWRRPTGHPRTTWLRTHPYGNLWLEFAPWFSSCALILFRDFGAI